MKKIALLTALTLFFTLLCIATAGAEEKIFDLNISYYRTLAKNGEKQHLDKEKIEKRKCKECDCEFEILKSKLKSSNTSGNFCSRKCYENYLCDTDRTTGRGSQWKK